MLLKAYLQQYALYGDDCYIQLVSHLSKRQI